MAELIQHVISPARLRNLTLLGASNQLQLINVPLDEDGLVEGSSNLVDWTTETPVIAVKAVQTIAVPCAGPEQFHRFRFGSSF